MFIRVATPYGVLTLRRKRTSHVLSHLNLMTIFCGWCWDAHSINNASSLERLKACLRCV